MNSFSSKWIDVCLLLKPLICVILEKRGSGGEKLHINPNPNAAANAGVKAITSLQDGTAAGGINK